MIAETKNPDAAWKFMKWYVGKDCQTEYANEMVAIIGDSAKHATANRYALESMPWTRDEYDEVSKQFENLAAIPNYPGSYFIGRHTSFAFLAAYNNDADPSTELLAYINTINKEITRKREEFNLETLEIGQTLATKRMNQAMNAIDALVALVGENSKYAEMIEDVKRGVANQKSVLLNDAALQFSATLDYNYIADLNAVGKDVVLDYETTKAMKQEIINNVKNYDFFIYVISFWSYFIVEISTIK
jgi:ABC-type glycerol-3-phosphate transport system substrate-binding protein